MQNRVSSVLSVSISQSIFFGTPCHKMRWSWTGWMPFNLQISGGNVHHRLQTVMNICNRLILNKLPFIWPLYHCIKERPVAGEGVWLALIGNCALILCLSFRSHQSTPGQENVTYCANGPSSVKNEAQLQTASRYLCPSAPFPVWDPWKDLPIVCLDLLLPFLLASYCYRILRSSPFPPWEKCPLLPPTLTLQATSVVFGTRIPNVHGQPIVSFSSLDPKSASLLRSIS